jgi:hypothetical protein
VPFALPAVVGCSGPPRLCTYFETACVASTPAPRSWAMFGGSRRRSVASAEPRAPLAEAGFLNSAGFVVPVLKKPASSPVELAQTADRDQVAAEPADARRAAFDLPPRPGKRPVAPGDDERARAQRARADPDADLPVGNAADAWCVTAPPRVPRRLSDCELRLRSAAVPESRRAASRRLAPPRRRRAGEYPCAYYRACPRAPPRPAARRQRHWGTARRCSASRAAGTRRCSLRRDGGAYLVLVAHHRCAPAPVARAL